MVFVHSSATDYGPWHSQVEEFAQKSQVITYSRRYHWPDETIGENLDYTMGEHAADLQALLHSLGSSPAHAAEQLKGSSTGEVRKFAKEQG